MYLIMELCKGGELSDELRRKTYFREEVCIICYCTDSTHALCTALSQETKVIMGRLTEAVVYMHDNGKARGHL